MTNLKRFVFVLAVPLLMMPQLAKTAIFNASDLRIKAWDINLVNTSKDNYVITYSNADVQDGNLFFDAQTANFSVGIANKSTANGMPLLQSVTYKLYLADNLDSPWQTVKVNSADESGKYNFIVVLNRLDLNTDYQLNADLVFASPVEGSIPVIINNPDVAILSLKHKEANQDPVFSENAQIIINPNISDFTFNYTTNNLYKIAVFEKDPNADSKIQAVKLIIKDINKDEIVYNKIVTDRSAQFSLNFNNNLELNQSYKAFVEVKYITDTEVDTHTYFVANFIGENYAKVTPSPVFSENYKISINPNLTDFTFNYTTNNNYKIAVSEKDPNADTQIQAVTLKIVNIDSNETAYSKTITGRSAQFNLNFDSGLRLEQSYKAFVEIKYITASKVDARTYFVANFIGENYAKVTPNPVFSENYKISINSNLTDFTFNYTTNNNYKIAVSEKDPNADSKIQATTLKIVNIDNNETAYSKTITGRSAQFNLNFDSGLRLEQSYKAFVEIKYITASKVDARTYFVANFIGENYAKINPVNPEPVKPVTPFVAQEIDNLDTNINITDTSNADYNNVYVATWQKNATVKYSMPRVSKIELLANASIIKTCNAGEHCSLNYKVYNPTFFQVKAYYVYDLDNGNYSYTKTYNLGTFSKDSVKPTPTGSNDPTLLNQYILIKGTGPQVYLVNKAGHRYYIPDWSILKSWYHSTPSIVQVNDAELPKYQLIGNVIYKPGSLIKIATDPKCYAVDKNGVLRWVINEKVARSIYGPTWNKNIYIVPDSLFPSYSFGSTIYSSADYTMPMLSDVVNIYNK